MPKAPIGRRTVSKKGFWRTELTLPEDTVSFLVGFGNRCKRMGGHKMAKTEIVRAAIAVLKKLERNMDLSGVMDEHDLEDRILDAIRRSRANKRKAAV